MIGVFIWVPKTAGTSIFDALSQHGMRKIKTNPRGFDGKSHVTFGHRDPKEVRAAMPNGLWDESCKFAFVRNPWDRLVSLYFYWKNFDDGHVIKSHPLAASTSRLNFRDFCKNLSAQSHLLPRMLKGDCGGVLQMCSQTKWIGPDESPNVDFIGRYENLEEDFSKVCRHLGVDAKLGHRNKSSHKHYSEYYDDETAKVVGEIYREDIERFGYEL